MSNTLFTPLKAGAYELPNRIVYSPLTRCRAEPGRVPGSIMAEYYRQRSSAGLIIESATETLAQGRADAVAFGRPFIANSDLPERFRNRLGVTPSRQDTWYTPGPEAISITQPSSDMTRR